MLEKLDTSSLYAHMNKRCVPYGVNLELTAQCNLDCIHCYHVLTSDPELGTEEVLKLLDDLEQLGTMEVTMTGGEPFLRSDLEAIIIHAVETNGFSVKLFSNLTTIISSGIYMLTKQ